MTENQDYEALAERLMSDMLTDERGHFDFYELGKLRREAAAAIRELRDQLQDCERLLFTVREEADGLHIQVRELEADLRLADKNSDSLHAERDKWKQDAERWHEASQNADVLHTELAACKKAAVDMRDVLEGCPHCDYDEAEGGLINHCDDCCRAITTLAWELFVEKSHDAALVAGGRE